MCYTFSHVTLLPLRMKNPLLNSGKFWLKTVVTAVILLVCTAAALYASVYTLFPLERIEASIQNTFSTTGRNIRFSSDIRRSWFPRPTVTLKTLPLPNLKATKLPYISKRPISVWAGAACGTITRSSKNGLLQVQMPCYRAPRTENGTCKTCYILPTLPL